MPGGGEGRGEAPVWLWWSSGKDSAWSLHVLRSELRLPVTRLLTTVTAPYDRVSMHAVPTALLRAQAVAAGVPLRELPIPAPCPNEVYERLFAEVVAEARAAGARLAFGDLFLEDVRAYRERLLEGSGVEPVFPIWGRDTRALAEAMVEAGLRAVLTCVDPKVLAPAFAGRSFDAALLADLPPDVDPCGERGEFHTFAHAGPMFSREIAVRVAGRVERDGFVFADVRAAGG